MGNPGAQHELACTLVQRYPHLTLRLAEIAGVKVPDYELAVAASNSHQLPDRPPLDGDGTIRFLRKGKPAFFAQIEVQQKHTGDKYATLRAYHGSEVSKAQAGGHMFVVSPDPAEAAKFRRSEVRLSDDYAYRGSYLSRTDLEPLADAALPFEERCLAIGMTNFTRDVPPEAVALLREATETDITIANLLVRTLIEEVSDVAMLEAVMDDHILEKLQGVKAWRDYQERAEQLGEKRGQAKAEAAAQARIAEAEDKAKKAEVTARADALKEFLAMRGDKPTAHALNEIGSCTSINEISSWLRRAYAGETSAEIFPTP